MHGDGGIAATIILTTGMKIGYDRVSTTDQDARGPEQGLENFLGVGAA